MCPIFDITKSDQVPLYGASDPKKEENLTRQKKNKSESTEKNREKDRFSRNGLTNAWLWYHKKNDLMTCQICAQFETAGVFVNRSNFF